MVEDDYTDMEDVTVDKKAIEFNNRNDDDQEIGNDDDHNNDDNRDNDDNDNDNDDLLTVRLQQGRRGTKGQGQS
jgi:hypothetical protein